MNWTMRVAAAAVVVVVVHSFTFPLRWKIFCEGWGDGGEEKRERFSNIDNGKF